METKLLVKETVVENFKAAFTNAKKHDRHANLQINKFDKDWLEVTVSFNDVQFLYWLGRYNQLGIDLNKLDLL